MTGFGSLPEHCDDLGGGLAMLRRHAGELEDWGSELARRLLAGLPPTMVVETENVRWREVARETRQIRDSSNRDVYTFDVSAELGGTVYVKFADSFSSDGWGASVGAVTIRADGAQLATFVPGTPA